MDSGAYDAVVSELGARVRTARQAAGLTQEDAAGAAGIDWRRWQRIEEGAVNPTIRTLVRVATVLDTDFWTLVGGTRPAPPPPRTKRASPRKR